MKKARYLAYQTGQEVGEADEVSEVGGTRRIGELASWGGRRGMLGRRGRCSM